MPHYDAMFPPHKILLTIPLTAKQSVTID